MPLISGGRRLPAPAPAPAPARPEPVRANGYGHAVGSTSSEGGLAATATAAGFTSASDVPAPAVSEPVATHRPRGAIRAAIATMRPRQWLKNVLVIAAAGAAGALVKDHVPVHVLLAFVAFCLIASGIYAVNDVRDVEEDRLHPRKRFRPVAAGEISPQAALILGCALMAGGLAICAAVRPLLFVVGAGYIALTVTYTLIWRHIVLLDLFAIAGGFVLRAVAGGVAAPVTLSRWFLAVITCAAVFIAAGKRHAELRRLEAVGVKGEGLRRRVLHRYSASTLRMVLYGSAAGTLFAYCVWAFQIPSVDGIPWRPLTIIPFALCLVRYGRLIAGGGGEAPEDLILSDRLLILAGGAWLVLFAIGVHAAS
jgi:decaprenyl-phosphate phosphoribosyltransferase